MSEEILDATPEMGSSEGRPVFITVLCILTWVGSGIGMLGPLTRGLNNYSNPLWYDLALAATSVVTAYAAYEIWNLKKRGLYIYTVAEVISIIMPIVYIYMIAPAFVRNMAMSVIFIYTIFPISFIVMYWVNAKHLK
ncbi:hypothetical protein K6119_18280 [Paracrocinitomix mangrovi]|uniref:hypothetical protein n=1 Tax=Paracrocinitomix mangrovi TaxID=2862509 RepID=UPI001C8DA8A2|nr:hypothetical protein [Paracrocinitomix mangrovi]UKN01674.1 hypothetical protein K6119_18280 [Paracrocinitomix mangrovi]